MPKYDVQVKLSGTDGNAFAVMGKVSAALKKAKIPEDEINVFTAKAMAGDYDHLLQVSMEWVDVR